MIEGALALHWGIAGSVSIWQMHRAAEAEPRPNVFSALPQPLARNTAKKNGSTHRPTLIPIDVRPVYNPAAVYC